ncbi:MAG: hypothetical protein AAGH89_02765 [Verrucomicrobiota bacterium]
MKFKSCIYYHAMNDVIKDPVRSSSSLEFPLDIALETLHMHHSIRNMAKHLSRSFDPVTDSVVLQLIARVQSTAIISQAQLHWLIEDRNNAPSWEHFLSVARANLLIARECRAEPELEDLAEATQILSLNCLALFSIVLNYHESGQPESASPTMADHQFQTLASAPAQLATANFL